MRNLILHWFWRHRAHGFRRGYKKIGPGQGRWDGACARCGGFEFGEELHPRGYVGPGGWLR